jgi:hypothetical protein
MGSSHTLDQLDICFDDTHAVANAGQLLAATLAERLGIQQAADAPSGRLINCGSCRSLTAILQDRSGETHRCAGQRGQL